MADEDILNFSSAPDAGTIPESTLAPSAAAEDPAAEIVEAAVPAEPAVSVEPEVSAEPAAPAELGETAEVTDHGSPGKAAAGNGKGWSPRPMPISKRRPGGQAVRHGNYSMMPKRFVTLKELYPKPVLAASDANKENSEARAARGVRRALWIIAIATALNVGVAALQWYELHRASSTTHTADAVGTINRASLP
jgi:hypothetical protein